MIEEAGMSAIERFQAKTIPPEQVAKFVFGRLSYALDAILMGLAVGTVIDQMISPRLLAPADSFLVENAMLPMVVALALMAAITLAYMTVATLMRDHPRWDGRHHVRRPVHFHLRLAYHAYLIFAGAGICIWTQIFLWHGHWVIWTFGVTLALVSNLVSQACRYGIRMDAFKTLISEKDGKKARPVEYFLIAMGIALAIVALVNGLHHR